MTLLDLINKAKELPEIDFDRAGPERIEPVENNIKTLEEVISYLKYFRDWIYKHSVVLDDLIKAYRKMKYILLAAEIDGAVTKIKNNPPQKQELIFGPTPDHIRNLDSELSVKKEEK